MSPGPDRDPRDRRREDRGSRAWERALEDGGPEAEDKKAGGLVEKGEHGAKDRREAREQQEGREHLRMAEDRVAEEAPEAVSSNPPKKW
jgi:hypothetical protein